MPSLRSRLRAAYEAFRDPEVRGREAFEAGLVFGKLVGRASARGEPYAHAFPNVRLARLGGDAIRKGLLS